jgi:hypothetical protein
MGPPVRGHRAHRRHAPTEHNGAVHERSVVPTTLSEATVTSSTPVRHRPAATRSGRRCLPLFFLCRPQQQANVGHHQVLLPPGCFSSLMPRVLVRCRRSVLELNHDTPVPTSLITGATCRSSGLAPVSRSTEPPPPPRALSGEPLVPEVPQMSPPPRRVAQATVPNPPRRWQMLESGRPPPPCCWGHGRSPTPWFATSPGRSPAMAIGYGLFSWAAR